MANMIRIADSKGRVTLPGFAHATVIVEAVSDSEYRVRKAQVIADDELAFPEENMPRSLSSRDAQRLLEILDRPSKPNAAARRAARRLRKKHG